MTYAFLNLHSFGGRTRGRGRDVRANAFFLENLRVHCDGVILDFFYLLFNSAGFVVGINWKKKCWILG